MAKEDYTMEERQEILKNLMLRLHAGEDKEVIQEEFNEVFDEISPYEIQLMERNSHYPYLSFYSCLLIK